MMHSDVQHRGARDPHDVLGVPRGADRGQVMRAFHRKALRGGHPDSGGDAETFQEIVRARDVLLDQARRDTYQPRQRATHVTTAPSAPTRPADSPPKETSKLAVVTGVLALLGPLFWPAAIVVGHLALRGIKRTGQGGGTLVTVVLLLLYVIALPVLLRILSLILIP